MENYLKLSFHYYDSTIQHEFIHSIGAYHVQSRPDRDDYVKINTWNIKSGKEHNFKKQSGALTYDIPYDPLSIMHYEYYAFARNKNYPTIESKVMLPFFMKNLSLFTLIFPVFRFLESKLNNLEQLNKWEIAISGLLGRCMDAVSYVKSILQFG